MIFKKLILNNWIPYKGSNEIEFSVDSKKNITLIRGNNKGGKSAVIRGLKWALYGDTGDTTRYKKARDLLNREAYNEGEFNASVQLHISSNKKEIIVSRELVSSEGIAQPKDNHFDENFSVTVNGKAQIPPEKYIKDLLDESISRFFLFDGEMLQDYKDLIDNPKESKKLQEHIERVLRTPQLKSSQTDLNSIIRRISRELAKSTKDDSLKDILITINDCEEALELKVNEQNEIVITLATAQEKHKTVKSDLDDLQEKSKELQKIDQLKTSLPMLEADINTKKNKIQTLSKDSWRMILTPLIDKKIDNIHSKKKPLIKEADKVLKLKTLVKSLELDKCFTCGNSLTGDEKNKLKLQIEDLKEEGFQDNPTQELDEDLKKLNDIRYDSSLDMLQQECNELFELRSRQAQTEVVIENLKDSVGNKGDEIASLSNEERGLDLQIRSIKEGRNNLSNQIDELNVQIEKYKEMKKKLTKSSSKQLDRLSEICTDLEKVFSDSIIDLSLETKGQIEDYANLIYPKMTFEQTKNSLVINDSFGLSLIDSNGENITPSSGGDQIVALSLLHGLKKSTGIEGPLLIDTPLGRIDEDHRALVLKNLPTMGTQCILLVHSGEIKAKSELEDLIASKVGVIHEIRKESDRLSTITKQ